MIPQLLEFRNKHHLHRALTNKIHELEYQSKTGQKYYYGNNEDLIISGHQILEFFFFDYLLLQGFPSAHTQFQKSSDLIQLRQKLINDKYLAEAANFINLPNFLNVGNQKNLKNNTKVLAESVKALIGAQYYDKFNDLEAMRDLLKPLLDWLLNKGEFIKQPELKNNPKSSFLEFLHSFKGEIDIQPKVTLEWQKDDLSQTNRQPIFTITLETNNGLIVQKKGTNKRETEQLVYLEALIKLKKQKLPQQKKNIKKLSQQSEIDNIESLSTSFNQSFCQEINQSYFFQENENNSEKLKENYEDLVSQLLEDFSK